MKIDQNKMKVRFFLNQNKIKQRFDVKMLFEIQKVKNKHYDIKNIEFNKTHDCIPCLYIK